MRRFALAVIAAATVLAGCGTDTPNSPEAGSPPPTTPSASVTTSARVEPPDPNGTQVTLRVEGGKRVEGPAEVEVPAGEQVAFMVRGDQPDELHLHGYDKTAELQPGKPAVIVFTADMPGVWELELHESGALLTELTVTG